MDVPRALSTASLIAALMLLGACGGSAAENSSSSTLSTDSATAASSPPSATCKSAARSVCVTAAANGRTITLAIGWTIELDLNASSSRWSAPSQVGAHLLRQLGEVRRQHAAVVVSYRTLAPGRTTLRAFERPSCSAGRVCPQFILLWQLHIRVTGR